MRHISMFMFSIAMTALTLVSMWTTYVSLSDSILPGPEVAVPIGDGKSVPLAVPALVLSVGIGMMLLALKFAIINERRNLGILGFAGLFIVAFISISFNVDVLYRVSHQDFMLKHADQKMRATYEDYMAEVQSVLAKRETTLLRDVARQEAELESEIEGLREAPAGFGERARAEKYQLNIMQKEAEVDLQNLEAAIIAKEKADELLTAALPRSIDDVLELETQLRVIVKDAGAVAGVPMPAPVELELPIFAVFSRLFDPQRIDFMACFILLTAIFLDLADIIGFNLVARSSRDHKLGTPPGSGMHDTDYAVPSREALPPPADADDQDDRAVSKSALQPNPPRSARTMRIDRNWSIYRR